MAGFGTDTTTTTITATLPDGSTVQVLIESDGVNEPETSVSLTTDAGTLPLPFAVETEVLIDGIFVAAEDGEPVLIDDLHGKPASAAMARKHLNERHDRATQDLSDPDLYVIHFDDHFNGDVDDHPL